MTSNFINYILFLVGLTVSAFFLGKAMQKIETTSQICKYVSRDRIQEIDCLNSTPWENKN